MYDEGRYSECREITKRVLDMAISDKNYKDVIDFRLDLLELNARLDEAYLNRDVLNDLLNDLKEEEIGENDRLELFRTIAKNYMNLNDYENALDCFTHSIEQLENDYAYFGCGICQYNLDLDIFDKFKKSLNLSKRQQLKQIIILNELGFFKDSLEICNGLSENHEHRNPSRLQKAGACR